jgi:tetratricopeptide (TPR) repeat protein
MTDEHPSMRIALRALAHEEFRVGRGLLLHIVEEAPTWADAWALLSGAHLAVAEVEQATIASERALALAPDRFLPRLKAGELAFRLGDVERATVEFLAALRAADPGTTDAAAAKQALAIARAAGRAGIAHRARLPGLRPLKRTGRAIEALMARVRSGVGIRVNPKTS